MSPRFSLDFSDIKKILKGAGIAGLGAVMALVLASGVPALDKESLKIWLAAALSVFVNASLKFLSDKGKLVADEEEKLDDKTNAEK